MKKFRSKISDNTRPYPKVNRIYEPLTSEENSNTIPETSEFVNNSRNCFDSFDKYKCR